MTNGHFEKAVQGEPQEYQTSIYHKGGHRLELEITNVPIRLQGDIVGVYGILKNITERKKILQNLQNSETKFQSVIHTTADAVVIADQQTRIMTWNRGAEIIFGFKEEEVLGQALDFIIPHSLRETHREGVERYCATGEGRSSGKTLELTGLRRDGTEFPLELSLTSWKTGEHLHFSAIIRDITAQKEEQERLRLAEEEYRLITENVQDLISYSTPDGICRTCLQRFASCWGTSQREVIGKLSYEFWHPYDVKYLSQRTFSDTDVFECRVLHKDGHYVWLETSLQFVRNQEGESFYVIGVAREHLAAQIGRGSVAPQ